MSSESGDPIVFKRNKGRIRKDVSKRIPFTANDIIDSQLQGVQILKHELDVATSLRKVRFEASENDEKVDVLKDSNLRNNSKKCFPSLLERGVPEGQEDPRLYSSTSDLSKSNQDFSANHSANILHANVPAQRGAKFSKSIPTKRVTPDRAFLESKNRIIPLYLPNLKRSDLGDYSVLTKCLSEEITKNAPPREDVMSCLKPSLSKLVTSENKCILYKVYKVLTIDAYPVLAAITSESLCFVRYCAISDRFISEYSCNFEDLLAAVVGPFSQIVIVLNGKKEKFFINTGLSESVASELISHLEVAIRRWCNMAKKKFNFSVAEIQDLKCMHAFHNILPDNTFIENEVVIAQYSVWLQEDYMESVSPLGPEKEGYLMTRLGVHSSWVPSYVCLKGGVLYLFDKNSQRIPKFVYPLGSSLFNGCCIRNNTERPHTFEILLEGNSSLSIGSADEFEMTEWLRDLYLSAMQASNIELADFEKESPLINCFVTLSNKQILLHRFPHEIIGRVFLNSVSSFTKSSWPNSYYCHLELCCREASERSGDWILYFVSENCFKSFCSKFDEIVDHSMTTYQVEEERFLMHKSDRISAKIRSSWNSFFI